MHANHEVSTKIALYSEDASRVLVMHYPKSNLYGLPGGHIEAGEEADVAMARELMEELAITVPHATRSEFFYTNRLILGYIAVVPTDFDISPTQPEKEYGVWLTQDELTALTNISEEYRRFIFAHWPSRES